VRTTSRVIAGVFAAALSLEGSRCGHPAPPPRSPAQHQGHQNDRPAPAPDITATPSGETVILTMIVRWDDSTAEAVTIAYDGGLGRQQFNRHGDGNYQWNVRSKAGQTAYLLLIPLVPGQTTNATIEVQRTVDGSRVCTDTNVDHGGKGGVDCSGKV